MEFSKEDIKDLGLRLQSWHVGGDAIYQAGSYLYAGHAPTFKVLFDALRLMDYNAHFATDSKNRADAHQVIAKLIDYIQYRTTLGMF